jgi:REP element-mobilizing transposase RayT
MTSPAPAPIYTPANTTAAFRLYWSFDLFWHKPPPDASWLSPLCDALRPHGIRVLRHRFASPTTSQILLSTQPSCHPQQVAKYLKGALQHIVRAQYPEAFQRNYGFRSLGSTKRRVVERYIAQQLGHHRLADPRFQDRLADLQFSDPAVDLSQPRTTSHSAYWYNLHIVLVNQARWREHLPERLGGLRDGVVRIARARGFALSQAGILPDHLHLALGVGSEWSPEAVALCCMNNLAYVLGMQAVFQHSYYVTTFSEYDLGFLNGKDTTTAPPTQGRWGR